MIGTRTARVRWRPIVAAALSASGVAVLGALTTELGPWYYALRKPAWQPPDWLFGPAWTVIFSLCAIAAVIFWRRQLDRDARLGMIGGFAANAFFNTLWSLLFFRLQRPDWSLYEVVLLWLSIVVLILLLGKSSRAAAWLLTPYLVWVTFAAFLNWKIVMLNAPFTTSG